MGGRGDGADYHDPTHAVSTSHVEMESWLGVVVRQGSDGVQAMQLRQIPDGDRSSELPNPHRRNKQDH